MARELGPKGIHVAHVVIDGAIDTEFIRSNFPERYALKDQDGHPQPGHIADQYWQLHRQPRDAWTHETRAAALDGDLLMSKSVDFYFDVGSPAAYLAWTQMPRLARETGATVRVKPFLLGGVFQATGNRSPMEVPAKSRWLHEDLNRFAARYGVPFRLNPHFPINTLMLMRGALGLQMREPDRPAALRRCRDARDLGRGPQHERSGRSRRGPAASRVRPAGAAGPDPGPAGQGSR